MIRVRSAQVIDGAQRTVRVRQYFRASKQTFNPNGGIIGHSANLPKMSYTHNKVKVYKGLVVHPEPKPSSQLTGYGSV